MEGIDPSVLDSRSLASTPMTVGSDDYGNYNDSYYNYGNSYSDYYNNYYGNYDNSYSDYSDYYNYTVYNDHNNYSNKTYTANYYNYNDYADSTGTYFNYGNATYGNSLTGGTYTETYYHNYSDYSDYSNYSNTTSITTNPSSQSVVLGDKATFTVVFSNSSVITKYQWYVASSDIAPGTEVIDATTASYSFTPAVTDDAKYYYCVATAPGGTVTSGRAMLTVKSLITYDIAVGVGKTIDFVTKMTPSTSTISNIISANTSIVTVTSNAIVGESEGQTTCTLTSSNGVSKTVNVYVYANELEAILKNIAIATRAKQNKTNTVTGYQMANFLENNNFNTKTYSSLEEFFTDIARIIKVDSTSKYYPKDFYQNILNKI